MKTLLALTTLLLSTTVCLRSEEPRPLPLDGFMGIKWGTSDDAARAQIVAKAKSHYNPKESTEKRLRFEGGEFAGFQVHHFLLAFENGGFHFSETQLVGITKNHRKEFLIFKQLLTEKYGAPNQEDQDADDLSATWYFRVPNQPANHISLFSSPKGPGLRFIYSSEGTKLARRAAPAPPLSVPASAKNDL